MLTEPADLNLRHLDGGQRRRGLQPLSRPDGHAVDAMCRPDSAIGLNPSIHQEAIMYQLIRGGAIAIAILGTIGFAAAQRTGSAQPELTANQQQTVSQGLATSPSQPTPSGEQAQVGKHVPDSMSPQAMPNNVTDQVPETKNLLFVKLPDRILLIDPDNKLVTQIVTDDNSSTTGSNTGGSSTNTSDRPSR
jgi:hypothetical protein